MEQPEFELAPIWDASFAGNNFTCYTEVLILLIRIKARITQMEFQNSVFLII